MNIANETKFYSLYFTLDRENSLKNESITQDVGVDVDNEDDLPMINDMDSMDHDSNDMHRPRKIRRWDQTYK